MVFGKRQENKVDKCTNCSLSDSSVFSSTAEAPDPVFMHQAGLILWDQARLRVGWQQLIDGHGVSPNPGRLLCPGTANWKRRHFAADSSCLQQGRLDLPGFITHLSRALLLSEAARGSMCIHVFRWAPHFWGAPTQIIRTWKRGPWKSVS